MTNPSLAAMTTTTVEVVYDNVPYRATFLTADEAMDWIARTVDGLLEHHPLLLASELRIRRLS